MFACTAYLMVRSLGCARVPIGGTAAGYTVTLPDGRRVGVKEYGDKKGKPIFQFHGAGSSRYEAAALGGGEEEACSGVSARLIALDRPGYGASDPQPKRTLLDYPLDVLAVADALGIDKFAVMGVSSGGCYAVACAYIIPRSQQGRLTGVALVSSDGPHRAADAPALVQSEGGARLLLGYVPFIPGLMLKMIRRMLFTSPDSYLAGVNSSFGEADAATMAKVSTDVALRAGKEGLKQGVWSLVR
jgi:pimeloyl-ACP methyl ester carboxylesterase